MNLKNGYKVLYEVLDNNSDVKNRVFKASKTSSIKDADTILSVATGTYKLIYEKGGKLYGSKQKVPTESDYCFTELDSIFTLEEDSETPQVLNELNDIVDEVENELEETITEEELPEADPEEV